MLQAAALLAALWSSWAVYSWLTIAVPAEDVIPARLVIFAAMAAMFVASLAAALWWAYFDLVMLYAERRLSEVRGEERALLCALAAFETARFVRSGASSVRDKCYRTQRVHLTVWRDCLKK